MLKIPKGLKKKKKDKKHKRKGGDDLFDKEELERYRQEHQQQTQATESSENVAEENANASLSSTEKGEEWKKYFNGIDNSLQKKKEDLDRIKSTSFFQRKAPPPPPPTVKPDKREDEVVDVGKEEKKKKKKERKRVDESKEDEKSAVPEESSPRVEDEHSDFEEEYDDADAEEEESEEEFVDDCIFETSYVDAVASGELKLAYIPDSPEKEDDSDPFDTSIADKFIESNPKKRYLNLGCAVQVLSGKTTSSPASVTLEKRTPKRRVKPVDLLLSSFDEGTNPLPDIPQGIEKYLVSDSPVKTLLDDGPVFDDSELPLPPAPAVTPIPAASPVPAPTTTAATTPQLDLSEFEVSIADTVGPPALTVQESAESVDDEFERLAAESLARKSSTEIKRPISIDFLTQNVLGSPGSGHPSPIGPTTLEKREPDPFDTSAADKHLLPGKQEISLLEKELLETQVQLSQLVDDDFDPRADTPPPVVVKTEPPPDILTNSPEETAFSGDGVFKPLTPKATTLGGEFGASEDYDPFDTSHVSGAPGKLELKLIEKELVGPDFEDNDFDPRKPEQDRQKITDVILNKYNVSLDSEKKTREEDAYVDILTGDQKTHEEFVPTVQPRKLSDPDEVDEAYVDPFDTSIADNIVPGKTELKILESELIN